jgi:outer membrane immunogenic protein
MKRMLIGIAAIASLLATSALAADLPARVYTKAPVVADPGYNWSGFYVGVNGGYSWGRSNATVVPTTPLAVNIGHDVNGGLGGAQAGYNWQIDRRWVLGVEADIQGTGERGGSIDPLLAVRIGNLGITGSANSNTSFPWFATFRGRAGILVDPSLLLYVTGGLAVGEVKFDSQATLTAQLFDGANARVGAPITVVGTAISDSQTRVGYTAGAGIEKKFDPHWSGKLEYLYIDLGSATYFGGTPDETRVRFHDHVFRAGINYEFMAGPVVAKY